MVPSIIENRTLSPFRDLWDEFFDEPVFRLIDRDVSTFTWPRVDITEEEKTYRIMADLPGLEKKDISVTVRDDILNISGEKKEVVHSEGKNRYGHYERRFGAFSRSFTLPDHVEPGEADARYHNGVLEIVLKKSEKVRGKAIEVKVD